MSNPRGKGVRIIDMSVNKYFDFKLKSGQTIVTRDGSRYLIVFRESDGKFWAIARNGMHLGSIRDGLIRDYNNIADPNQIVKVYDCMPFFNYTYGNDNLVWKIEDEERVKELTMEEIADKFGISVDKLRIKD